MISFNLDSLLIFLSLGPKSWKNKSSVESFWIFFLFFYDEFCFHTSHKKQNQLFMCQRPAFFEPEPRSVTMVIARSYINFGNQVYDLVATRNEIYDHYIYRRINENKWQMLDRILSEFRFNTAIDYDALIPEVFRPHYMSASIWFQHFGVRFNVERWIEEVDDDFVLEDENVEYDSDGVPIVGESSDEESDDEEEEQGLLTQEDYNMDN